MSDDAPLCYLDACAIMFLVDSGDYPDRTRIMVDVFDAAENGRLRLATSMLSEAEVAFADYEKRHAQLDPQVEAKIEKLWHPASPIRLVEVHETIIREARSLLRDAASRGLSMGGSSDMVHLATALREGADYLMTYDERLRRWNGRLGITVMQPSVHVAVAKPEDQRGGLFDDDSESANEE